jgi:hypothetical protein
VAAGLAGVLGADGAGCLAGVLADAGRVDGLVGVFAAAPVAMARVWNRGVSLGSFASLGGDGDGEIGSGRERAEEKEKEKGMMVGWRGA